MASNRLAEFIMIFNLIMGLLFFVSSQLMLIFINQYEGVAYVGITQITVGTLRGLVEPIPNLPFYILLLTLISNAIFLVVLLRSKNSS
jgi:uncharacterized membrane protein YwaF